MSTNKENGKSPEVQTGVYPASAFTDLDDPVSRANFKALMQSQYGFSGKSLDRSIDMMVEQRHWQEKAYLYLIEITDPEHEYFGRIGQLMYALPGQFVGKKPLRKVKADEIGEDTSIELKLALVTEIEFTFIDLADGQYRLLKKSELSGEEIEMENEDGRVGTVVDWKKGGEHPTRGFYHVSFSGNIVEVEDRWEMEGWRFRKARGENKHQ